MNNITKTKANSIDKLDKLASMRSNYSSLASDAACELRSGSSATALQALKKMRDQNRTQFDAGPGDQLFDEVTAEYARCVQLLKTI